MGNEARATSDATKDEYPPDTQFGRVLAKEEELSETGAPSERHEEPRPGNTAERSDRERVDEESEQSFPASDPPASTPTTGPA